MIVFCVIIAWSCSVSPAIVTNGRMKIINWRQIVWISKKCKISPGICKISPNKSQAFLWICPRVSNPFHYNDGQTPGICLLRLISPLYGPGNNTWNDHFIYLGNLNLRGWPELTRAGLYIFGGCGLSACRSLLMSMRRKMQLSSP